jgi:excisionase family DNA binding protein
MTINRHTPIQDLPEFLTPEEYQAFLGISRAVAYAHLQTGEVRGARRFGRLWRIPKAAIVAAQGERAS